MKWTNCEIHIRIHTLWSNLCGRTGSSETLLIDIRENSLNCVLLKIQTLTISSMDIYEVKRR
jgi:hypothetical protein